MLHSRTFEFVDEPDSDYFCPVCQDLLTHPFLLECKHHVCRKCRIQLISTSKRECPTCRTSITFKGARIDKSFREKVNSVSVHCQNHKKGCEWVGEIKYLQNHLDLCKGESVVACPFRCGKYSWWKREMKEHKSLHCPNRPTLCKNCEYYNTFTIVTEKHNPICLKSPIDCPNHCLIQGLKRHQLQQHLNECTLQLLDCPQTGCSVQLPRKEMKPHTQEQHNLQLEETNQAINITPLEPTKQ